MALESDCDCLRCGGKLKKWSQYKAVYECQGGCKAVWEIYEIMNECDLAECKKVS